jgi:hypothetical protein
VAGGDVGGEFIVVMRQVLDERKRLAGATGTADTAGTTARKEEDKQLKHPLQPKAGPG